VLYETKREEKRVLRRQTNVKLEVDAKLFIVKIWGCHIRRIDLVISPIGTSAMTLVMRCMLNLSLTLMVSFFPSLSIVSVKVL
jgi:hypothetical protein